MAIALISTIAITPLARKLAVVCDAIDYPDQRRVNTEPIPRMGGVAIFGGIAVAFLVLNICLQNFNWFGNHLNQPGLGLNYVLIASGVVFIFCVGLVDDIIGLRARYKFIGQTIAATIVCMGGLMFSFMENPFGPGMIEFGWWSYPITIFYLVAFANIINLIDGLDGLASGISIITAATLGFYGILSMKFDVVVLSAIIIGSCLGFLKFNHHPASIFMGDSGSLTLGLCLGIISLLAVARTTFVFSLLIPILAAGVPIIDTFAAIIRRKIGHQKVSEPDRGHIHHRLLAAGFSQNKTVAIMWGWSALLSICGLVFTELEGIAKPISLIIAAAVTGYAIFKLKLLEPVLKHYYNPKVRKGNDGNQGNQS